ncbi:HAMP domain-containing protein [bacterium]|nr:HAMP domain-containing protein [bacterium]
MSHAPPRSLARNIFVNFSALIAGLFLVLGVVAVRYAYTSILENEANELRVASIGLSQLVTRQFHRGESSLRSAANDSDIKGLLREPANETALRGTTAQLNRRVSPSRELSNISLYDANGRCIASTDPAFVGHEAVKEDFFQKGLRTFHFSEISTTPDARKVQLISIPVRDNGKSLGVLAGQINLAHLYELMDQKLGISESSEAFLIDHRLRFVTPGKSGSTLLTPSHIKPSTAQRANKESFWVSRYENNKRTEVLGTVMPLKEFNWYLVIETPFREIRDSLFNVVTVLVGAGLALLAGTLWLSRRIAARVSRPIEMLTSSAKNISAGDLNTPVEAAPGSIETAILARELESMRARLADARRRLTERLATSEKLRIESERLAAIGTMASTLAHEIRNPLNALSLLIAKASSQVAGAPAALASLASMRGEIQRLEKLVGNVLDYARPLTLDLQPVNLVDLVGSVIELYRPLAEKIGVELESHVGPGDFTARVDRDKFKQSLVNLLQNSLDAMGDVAGDRGKALKVNTFLDRDEDSITIRMIDEGRGIANVDPSRLFDLFYTTKTSGTGLGLSTVRKIIVAHGGEIEIAPNPSGPGAMVTIGLPA